LPAVLAGTTVLALLFWSAPLAEVDVGHLWRALPAMAEFGGHLLTWPDRAYLPDLGKKMLETLEMAFLATSLALVLSLPVGFLAAANTSPHPLIFHATRALLSAMRALPELVWALIFVSAVGLGPLPGVMALAFVTVGFMGKFFAESLEVVDPRPVEGVAAHGAGWLQLRAFAHLPQALPDLIGTTLYILDHNVRAAAILGLVGAGGIGYDMVMSMRLFDYGRLILIALAIYLTVTALDRLSARFRAKVI
jgi:phosphonate transport system permease protein